ncbi:MAG: hypothetical protein ACOWYE_03265 [Desulfatiglandales bacterium]
MKWVHVVFQERAEKYRTGETVFPVSPLEPPETALTDKQMQRLNPRLFSNIICPRRFIVSITSCSHGYSGSPPTD